MLPRSITRRTTCGSSQAPGQRTISIASASPPERTIASTAPAISGSTISPLNRLATIAKRRPAADRVPSRVVGISARDTLTSFASGARRAGRNRDALDDVDPAALEAGDLAGAVHHPPDL